MLVTVPPVVVTVMVPVFAAAGTVAVTWVSELMTNVAAAPPIVTLVVFKRLTPVIFTVAATGAAVGAKVVSCGVTRNFVLLVRVPADVVTVMGPVVAPAGTVVVM